MITAGSGYTFIYTSPEMIAAERLKLAVICGIILSLPVSLIALWKFARPAMKKNEKRIIFILMTFGLALFFSGVFFAYKVIFPVMIRFFQTIDTAAVAAYISIAEYINFLITVCAIFGVAFELPIIMTLLARVGIVRKEFFCEIRKYAVVLIFIAAALITPSDVFSMLITALPLTIIYAIGTISVKLFCK